MPLPVKLRRKDTVNKIVEDLQRQNQRVSIMRATKPINGVKSRRRHDVAVRRHGDLTAMNGGELGKQIIDDTLLWLETPKVAFTQKQSCKTRSQAETIR